MQLPSKQRSSRLLLIGWDAADWQMIHPLLDNGLMPNLQRLIEGGVIGNLASLSPMLSPVLWTSIATGKRCYAHGVRGFIEPLPDRSGVRPVGTPTRRVKALWNIVSQSDRKSIVCGWQASHPAEPIRGVMVSNLFFSTSAYDAPELADSERKCRASSDGAGSRGSACAPAGDRSATDSAIDPAGGRVGSKRPSC